MPATKYLIVNADDFGLTDGVNQAIIEAHINGIVTSASLMVRAPFAKQACIHAQSYPRLSVGVHLDLGEWTFRNNRWIPVYETTSLNDAEEVRKEVFRQLDAFRQLMGRDPTHLDSHQHVHLRDPMRSVVLKVSQELSVPLRHFAPSIRYCGDFYGQSEHGFALHHLISAENLYRIIQNLPEGITELACHPGYGPIPNTMYSVERPMEVRALCDPDVRAALGTHGVELRSFLEIPPSA